MLTTEQLKKLEELRDSADATYKELFTLAGKCGDTDSYISTALSMASKTLAVLNAILAMQPDTGTRYIPVSSCADCWAATALKVCRMMDRARFSREEVDVSIHFAEDKFHPDCPLERLS